MQNRLFWITSFVFAAALFRIIPHPPNFSPLFAMALFAGAKLPRSVWAFAIPISAMVLSDLYLGFHTLTLVVYGSIAVATLLGMKFLSNREKTTRVAGLSLTGSALFFIITNFAHWLIDPLYAKDFTGLMACYLAAVPFLHWTVLSDLIFSFALFRGYAWMISTAPAQVSARS